MNASGVGLWSIRTRLVVLVLVGLGCATTVGVIGMRALTGIDAATAEVMRNAEAMHHAQFGDMMHDAIRGDVLGIQAAMLDKADPGSLAADLVEHTKGFSEAFEGSMKAAEGNPKLVAALSGLKPELDRYLALAARATSLIEQRDPGAGLAVSHFACSRAGPRSTWRRPRSSSASPMSSSCTSSSPPPRFKMGRSAPVTLRSSSSSTCSTSRRAPRSPSCPM